MHPKLTCFPFPRPLRSLQLIIKAHLPQLWLLWPDSVRTRIEQGRPSLWAVSQGITHSVPKWEQYRGEQRKRMQHGESKLEAHVWNLLGERQIMRRQKGMQRSSEPTTQGVLGSHLSHSPTEEESGVWEAPRSGSGKMLIRQVTRRQAAPSCCPFICCDDGRRGGRREMYGFRNHV